MAEGPLKKSDPPKANTKQSQQMKTRTLELTVYKISTLLQRGYGEKGAFIVSRVLTHDHNFMDLQIPGRKVNNIFSVC